MSNNSILDDEWLSSDQVAKILGITRNALENTRSKGGDTPTYYKLNKNVRYKRADVIAWLEKRRRVPAATQLAEAS